MGLTDLNSLTQQPSRATSLQHHSGERGRVKEWEIETGREGGREREQNRQRWEEGTEVEKEGVGWKYSEDY